MSLAAKLLSASGGVDKLYVDDVFSAYTYTGNGSTQTINNGIDLAGKGGMVWLKNRNIAVNNYLFDTNRGMTYAAAKFLTSNEIGAEQTGTDTLRADSSGYSIGTNAGSNAFNASASLYASWTFRKAPKFFDVVTYTGNGSTQNITHSLGQTPGMIIVKQASGSGGGWSVWHRSLAFGNWMYLNTTLDQQGPAVILFGNNTINVDPTSSVFTIGSATNCNTTGQTYVAYLFAHDTSADGIVQCGSFTTDGSGNATVNLGWEPQWLLLKRSNGSLDWRLVDSMRGLNNSGENILAPNTSATEIVSGTASTKPTATGFTHNGNTSATYIYLAIRRPNKPPTVGTQVYNAIARTGTGAAATVTGVGFAPDLVVSRSRNGAGSTGTLLLDRLRGVSTAAVALILPTTYAEQSGQSSFTSLDMNGATVGTDAGWNHSNSTGNPFISHFFKRAPGVFDVVCYTGAGVAKTEAHGLGVAPELWIVKSRTGSTAWAVGGTALANTEYLTLNTTDAKAAGPSIWNSTSPTTSVFSIGASSLCNNSTSDTYVAYLFATKAGISKVGSYTGNGTSQTIDAGFTTGARFVMIKRTDSTGYWYIWDTVRGLVAGNDPHLSLNATAAEITTDDSLDPASVGFIVNQLAATNINVASASYVYLSFA